LYFYEIKRYKNPQEGGRGRKYLTKKGTSGEQVPSNSGDGRKKNTSLREDGGEEKENGGEEGVMNDHTRIHKGMGKEI